MYSPTLSKKVRAELTIPLTVYHRDLTAIAVNVLLICYSHEVSNEVFSVSAQITALYLVYGGARLVIHVHRVERLKFCSLHLWYIIGSNVETLGPA